MEDGNERCRCSFTTMQEPSPRRSDYRPSDSVRAHDPGSAKSSPWPYARARGGVNRAPEGSGAVSLGLLLFCLLGLSLLFALAAARSDMPAVTAAAYRSALNTESDSGYDDGQEQELGRLRLVQMPGMLTVFAPSDDPILPLPMDRFTVEDDLTVKVYAPAGTEVVSVLKGTVRSVVSGGSEGGVVTVAHAGDIEITYYGLGDIRVERGQPVLQRTVLGCTESDVLRIRVTRNGRPIDPTEFFGAGAKLF